jgi:pimeloyl-ACP methyl ester carboxylesterase
MTAPELRAFVHAVLGELEDEPRTALVDSLMARAARGSAGWKPNRPTPRIVNDARAFADAARQVGYAEPGDVSEYLRLASEAFLAGDHASARVVFEALLLPIATVDIDLGQHELVADVLSADVHETQPTQTVAALVHADERLKKEFPRMTLPVLILHGTRDEDAKPSGSQFFYDTVGARDKTLKLYEGYVHDLLNDVGKEAVMADITSWIGEHAGVRS